MDVDGQDGGVRLCDFLRSHQDDLVAMWTKRVRQLSPARVLAIVSHDLKSPLAAIPFAANLVATKLPESPESPESGDRSLHRNVATIRRATDRMAHLITDLLDVASIQAGRLSIAPCGTAVGNLLDEVMASQEVVAGQKRIVLRREDTAHALRVRVDPDRFMQVMGNLIGNAVKFCDEGETVGLGAAPRGGDVVFSARDGGLGISADELETSSIPTGRRRGTRARAPASGSTSAVASSTRTAGASGPRAASAAAARSTSRCRSPATPIPTVEARVPGRGATSRCRDTVVAWTPLRWLVLRLGRAGCLTRHK